MKRQIFVAAGVMLLLVTHGGCRRSLNYSRSWAFTVENPTELWREDEVLALDVDEIQALCPDFNPQAFIVVGHGECPSQVDDLDLDGRPDRLFFVTTVRPKEKKTYRLRYAPYGIHVRDYPKRTHAELSHKVGGRFVGRKYEGGTFQNVRFLRVPNEHTDHSTFIRYEGPGWESDRVGYRFYLDWRNAIDVFGKKITEMVLPRIGLDGFDSYHEMADWGMDILKVGESLGIGSLGMWIEGRAQRVAETDSVHCRIVSDGPVYSHIRTQYFGWKVGGKRYDLTSDLSITAGSRLTRHDVTVVGDPPNLCTGIVRLEDTQFLSVTRKEGEWMALGTYGIQSLAGDKLGLAVVFRKGDLLEVTEDPHSHVVVLRPQNGKLTYYFLAAWEGEPGGIRSETAFSNALQETVWRLDRPVIVKMKD